MHAGRCTSLTLLRFTASSSSVQACRVASAAAAAPAGSSRFASAASAALAWRCSSPGSACAAPRTQPSAPCVTLRRCTTHPAPSAAASAAQPHCPEAQPPRSLRSTAAAQPRRRRCHSAAARLRQRRRAPATPNIAGQSAGCEAWRVCGAVAPPQHTRRVRGSRGCGGARKCCLYGLSYGKLKA